MTDLNDRSFPNVQVNFKFDSNFWNNFYFLDNDDGFIAAMEINSDSEILSREKRHDSL